MFDLLYNLFQSGVKNTNNNLVYPDKSYMIPNRFTVSSQCVGGENSLNNNNYDMVKLSTCFGCRGCKYKSVKRSIICSGCLGIGRVFETVGSDSLCIVCHGIGTVDYNDLEECIYCK